MPTPAAPSITSVTLSPTTLTVGVPITAVVTWTGYPQTGVAYRWRRGPTPIADAASEIFVPTEQWADLNCLVTIDNGRGTATGASAYAEIAEPDGALGDIWPDDSTIWPDDDTIWPAGE